MSDEKFKYFLEFGHELWDFRNGVRRIYWTERRQVKAPGGIVKIPLTRLQYFRLIVEAEERDVFWVSVPSDSADLSAYSDDWFPPRPER